MPGPSLYGLDGCGGAGGRGGGETTVGGSSDRECVSGGRVTGAGGAASGVLRGGSLLGNPCGRFGGGSEDAGSGTVDVGPGTVGGGLSGGSWTGVGCGTWYRLESTSTLPPVAFLVTVGAPGRAR
jgi:hypothetical protein